MTNYNFFIGIDISKEWIDVAFSESNSPSYLNRYQNSYSGFESMVEQLEKLTKHPKSEWICCFENTGSYSRILAAFLMAEEIPFNQENPRRISVFLSLSRGKDDISDSIGICSYAYEHRKKIQAHTIGKQTCQELKRILSHRELLVKQCKALSNDISENVSDLLYENEELLSTGASIIIDTYKKQIEKLELRIKVLIKERNELDENFKLIQSVKGVGPIIAAYIIAYSDNFNRFDLNPRKFACYCGIVPFQRSSGKRKGKDRVSHMANKKLKALLTNAAISAIRWDTQMKEYFQRKRKEGKPYGLVLNAVKNKIVARIFAVVRRKSPFVDINTYA